MQIMQLMRKHAMLIMGVLATVVLNTTLVLNAVHYWSMWVSCGVVVSNLVLLVLTCGIVALFLVGFGVCADELN